MTSSQVVWAIDELVRLICSQILEYRFSVYLQHDMIHDDLVLDPNSRRMLARCVLYLNRSISRIAVKLLWKELGSLDPLCALFPVDYLQRNEAEYICAREGILEDFDRFCTYSMHVRHLGIAGWVLPDAVMDDYIRLFPDRPFLPRVQSINTRSVPFGEPTSLPWLRFLLHSSTPAENQTSASASTLKHIRMFDTLALRDREGAMLLALDLFVFQHSNVMLGGGLESFEMQSSPCISTRRPYQDIFECAFVLRPPGTVDSPAYGLRHLKVPHFLRDLPDFFQRVARMRALEHLIIVIEESKSEDNMWEVEEKQEGVHHSLSSLEIKGFWEDLSRAINLCASPSATVPLRTLGLHYYGIRRDMVMAQVAQVLDLPTVTIPPDHLETLTIELLEEREYPICQYLCGLMLTTNELQPLLQYRHMVKLHLDLPCTILLDIKFLHELASVMKTTLRHLVIMRAMEYRRGSAIKPALTVDDLATIAGVILPQLETLGLDVTWCDKPLSAKQDCLVTSSLLRTLHVGTERTLLSRRSWKVAKFLKDHFPDLQYLYRHNVRPLDDGWYPVIRANGYKGGYW